MNEKQNDLIIASLDFAKFLLSEELWQRLAKQNFYFQQQFLNELFATCKNLLDEVGNEIKHQKDLERKRWGM